MRIAYVIMHVEQSNMLGGVGRKIEFQTSQWKQTGHEVKSFILMSGHEGENIYTCRTSPRVIKDVNRCQPDVIYLRYGRYAFLIHTLAKTTPIILEINTKDIDERRVRGGYFYWSHLFSRQMLFGNMSGFAAVSHEAAELPPDRGYRKPICVISSGGS
jgi:hypothetical protein